MVQQSRQFFHLFQSKYRNALSIFFNNRERELTSVEVAEMFDEGALHELLRLNVILEEDTGFRLDERAELFFEQMLEAGDSPPVEWLETDLKEFDRWEGLYHQSEDPAQQERSVVKLVRLLKQLRNRLLRQNADLQRAADYDYRTEAIYEIKEAKLQWRLEETETLRKVLTEIEERMRNSALFHTNRDVILLRSRGQLLDAIIAVGQGVIQSYQRIAEYLNRVRRDHARARKLIQLQDLIDRYELEARTNVQAVADAIEGPLIENFSLHSLLAPSLVDENPAMLARVLSRLGIGDTNVKPNRVVVPPREESSEPEIVIDAEELLELFARQERDLFDFLSNITLDGEPIEIDRRIALFCEILTTPDLLDRCHVQEGQTRHLEEWEYLEVLPIPSPT